MIQDLNVNTFKYCEYELRNNIAILYLNHGPVNALSFAIREEIYNFLYQQATEQTIQAVVLTHVSCHLVPEQTLKSFLVRCEESFF